MMLIPFQRRVGFGLLLLGALLITVAVRNLSREYLPAAIEATLEPIQRQVIINLRHRVARLLVAELSQKWKGLRS